MAIEEEVLKNVIEYYESNEEFIKSVNNLNDDSTKIDNILIYLNSQNNIMKSDAENNFSQIKMFESLNESIQSIGLYVKELNERILKLENQ